MPQPATPTEVLQSLLARKRRTMARIAGDPVDLSNPFHTVTQAVRAAEARGAIEILEEALLEVAGVESVQQSPEAQS